MKYLYLESIEIKIIKWGAKMVSINLVIGLLYLLIIGAIIGILAKYVGSIFKFSEVFEGINKFFQTLYLKITRYNS